MAKSITIQITENKKGIRRELDIDGFNQFEAIGLLQVIIADLANTTLRSDEVAKDKTK